VFDFNSVSAGVSQRVGRCLERQGLLEQDTESAWLDLDPAEDTDAMPQILGSSISYRIAIGPQQGRKAFMIRTIRPIDSPDPGLERVGKANGFSLHAGVCCEGHQKNKRERLCRYIARPAIAIPRLSLSSTGKVVYTLKTPYRDGTTQVAFDPVDFIARLAALVPKPRVNLTRYHGSLPQIIACVGQSRQPGVAKQQCLSPKPRSDHQPSAMQPEPAPLYRV
jgi:hypothetical protein